MVVDQSITEALNRIAENQEEMNSILNRIASHYDGVVPVMTRNANRAEAQGKAIDEEMENSFGEKVRSIFKPQAN
jgi:hypothetical protein